MRDKATLRRFLAGGLVNTAVSYLLFVGLARHVSPRQAYTMAYAAGIVLSYVTNAQLVFRSGLSIRTALGFPLVYLIQYLWGVSLLTVLAGALGVPPIVAMLIVISTSIPITFLLSRQLLSGAGSMLGPKRAL